MYIGIDLGSRSVKLALQEEDKAMWLEKFDTLQFYRDYGKRENGRLVVEAASIQKIASPFQQKIESWKREPALPRI
jgi:activator of 2-hydroxyglutaryl-CoA dehydratase